MVAGNPDASQSETARHDFAPDMRSRDRAIEDRPGQKHHKLKRAAAAVLAPVAATRLAYQFVKYPDRYKDIADFGALYEWWSRYRTGRPLWNVPMRDLGSALRVSLPCNYTPAFVVAFAPMSLLPTPYAWWVWQIAMLACLIGAVFVLARSIDLPLDNVDFAIFASLVFLFPPLYGALMLGQFTELLLLLSLLCWTSARRKNHVLAGGFLAMVALLKLFPAALAGYFLARRQFRPLVWGTAVFILGVYLSGIGNWFDWISNGTRFSLAQSWQLPIGQHFSVLSNVSALVRNATGAGGAIVYVTAGSIDLAIIATAALCSTRSGDDADADGLSFGIWLLAAPLLSPLAWGYELLLAVPAGFFAAMSSREIFNRGRWRDPNFIIGVALIAVICPGLYLFRDRAAFGDRFFAALALFAGSALILKARIDLSQSADDTAIFR